MDTIMLVNDYHRKCRSAACAKGYSYIIVVQLHTMLIHDCIPARLYMVVQSILISGADPGFFLGGVAPSFTINIVVFAEYTRIYQFYQKVTGHPKKGRVHSPCTFPLDPSLNINLKIP